ncbi:EAL domain-containing protein [bacterium]|nr:EAL domain-containing protein [bacterium]
MILRHIRILIVENDHKNVGLLKQIVADCKATVFEFVHVQSLKDGLAVLKSNNHFDIVLLNLNLRDARRLKAFEMIYGQVPHVPIVILTRESEDELALSAVHGGAQDYLVMDEVSQNLFIRVIHYAIERNRLLHELEASRKVERFLAYHDSLTNLPNRHLFYDHLKQATLHAQRYEQLIAVLFVDLDGFKTINERLGHTAGDLILQESAERLSACIRKSDIVARWGGDEFTILLSRITQSKDAAKVAQKILYAFSQPFLLGDQEFSITTSVGIGLFPSDATDEEGLVRKADAAMYRVKRSGKNNWRHFDASMDDSCFEHYGQVSSLQKAILEGELTAYFQPQIDLASGEIKGVEALVRWHHPELGLIEPSEFMPLAEESGLIKEIDRWMLRTVCEHAQALRAGGLPPIRVSVNLSEETLQDKAFPRLLARMLEDTGFDPGCLALEMAPDNPVNGRGFGNATLQEIKQIGVQIAYHQFGTGYSSLEHLRDFPRDILKIDRTLVQNITSNAEDMGFATAIMALAQSMNLKVIAEGVETEEQFECLSRPGCDEIQGYYVSQPIPADSLFALLFSKMYHNGRIAQA